MMYKFLNKRAFEFTFALIALILLSPIFLMISIFILIKMGTPVLFKQSRPGLNNEIFEIYKFRTMTNKLDKYGNLLEDKERLSNFGKFLRSTSLDELPTLWNVLCGNMSIVGPRPHMVEHDIHYSSLFKNFLKRHKCNPGLTGWAQVNGLRGATPKPEIMEKRMDYDLWYLNNWSIWLDIYIIFKTFYALFKFKGD